MPTTRIVGSRNLKRGRVTNPFRYQKPVAKLEETGYGLFHPMSARDRLILTPWEKWVKYKRFPIKIVFQLLVLITLIVNIVLTSRHPPLIRSNLKAFRQAFLAEHLEGCSQFQCCVEVLNKTVQSYFNINDYAVGNFSYVPSSDGIIPPVSLKIVKFVGGFLKTFEYSQDLETPLGPFGGDDESTKIAFQNVESMQQSFYLIESDSKNSEYPSRWHVTITYEITGNWVELDLDIIRYMIPPEAGLYTEAWLAILLLVFSSISTIFSIKRMILGYRVYRRSAIEFESIPKEKIIDYYWRTQVTPVYLEWSRIPFWIKLEFISTWHMLSLFGDTLIIIAQSLRLAANVGEEVLLWVSLCTGAGTLILCVNFLKYLEYNMRLHTLVVTLRVAAQRLARFIVSTLPVWFGYILCGVILFSPYSDDFSNTDESGVSLYSLLNADAVHDTFDSIAESYPILFVARVYIYTFVGLVLSFIIPLLLFIMRDSYWIAQALTGDVHRSGEESVDDRVLLLWENIQLEFNLRHLFEIIELGDVEKQSSDVGGDTGAMQSPPVEGELVQHSDQQPKKRARPKQTPQSSRRKQSGDVQEYFSIPATTAVLTNSMDDNGTVQLPQIYRLRGQSVGEMGSWRSQRKRTKVLTQASSVDTNSPVLDDEDEINNDVSNFQIYDVDKVEDDTQDFDDEEGEYEESEDVIYAEDESTAKEVGSYESSSSLPSDIAFLQSHSQSLTPQKQLKLISRSITRSSLIGRRTELTADKMTSMVRQHQAKFLNEAKRNLMLTQTKFLDAITQELLESLLDDDDNDENDE